MLSVEDYSHILHCFFLLFLPVLAHSHFECMLASHSSLGQFIKTRLHTQRELGLIIAVKVLLGLQWSRKNKMCL